MGFVNEACHIEEDRRFHGLNFLINLTYCCITSPVMHGQLEKITLYEIKYLQNNTPKISPRFKY